MIIDPPRRGGGGERKAAIVACTHASRGIPQMGLYAPLDVAFRIIYIMAWKSRLIPDEIGIPAYFRRHYARAMIN